jgi:hypothetical protein
VQERDEESHNRTDGARQNTRNAAKYRPSNDLWPSENGLRFASFIMTEID